MAIPGFEETELPEGIRAFDDTDKAREAIYTGVVQTLSDKFPKSDGLHRLELDNLHYTGNQDFTQEAQKRALMSNRSLNTPLTGTWKLVDETTGKTIDERQDVVMHVPYYTPRGTVINRGNEYSIVNQARLKPGVYTRTKQSGEHEAHFNIKPGTGRTFRMWMEPATGIFRVNVGQANIPAYPFLKIMGISDEQMQKVWGAEIYDANVKKTDKKALEKLYKRFAGKNYDKDASPEEMTAFLRESIPESVLDAGVVAKTMGLDSDHISPELLLRSTQKLLNISRGEEEEDDRESPQFSNFYSVEDFIKERIDKDAGHIAQQMLWKIRRDKNLKRVGRGALNPYIQSLILGSGLASPLEETNPFQILDQQTRVVKLGEGGIGSAEMVIEEARDVNPGQLGFIDPVAGPESSKVGVDVRTAYGTYKGDDNQIYSEFLDASGNKVLKNPGEVADMTLGFPGQDPEAPEVYALDKGKIKQVKREDVDLWVPSQEHMFGAALNMTPMVTGYMPSRAFYSAKYWSQYLPMVEGEAPLVQSAMPGSDRSFSEYYGRKVAAVNSKVRGVVKRVTKNGITILDEDGKKHFVETVKDFPFNRLTAISYTPAVKTGDVVDKGDLLATSNFTDENGALSLGRNLRTAVVPARGHSFEDAMVISESAAKKLATERLYGIDKEGRHGVNIARNKFISAFPSKYTKEQIENIGEDGVAKPGTVLQKGDPVVLAVGPKLLSSADAEMGKLHKAMRNAFRDESVEWHHSAPGVVVDTGRTTTGVKVNVKSQSPVQVGDKLSTLGASKGVVGKVLPDEEMPRDNKTGEIYEMLLNPMVILSRVAPNQLLEMQLGKIARKTGKPYVLPSEAPDEGWNKFVENELNKHGLKSREEVYDPVTGQTLNPVGTGVMYLSAFQHLAEKKLCVSEDTEVLTDSGWKPASKVCMEDKICTLNPSMHRSEYHHPDAIRVYDEDEALYHVTGPARDEMVTLDHRIYLRGRMIQLKDFYEEDS